MSSDSFPSATPAITIHYNGREIPTQAGDTVAAALFRAGVRIFSRSFKYHRPRGLLCVTGRCPNCLMQVDGVPNVRTCVTPVRDGQRVAHQNAYPSPDFDLLAVTDRLGALMPVGFYYKTFTQPRVWHLVEPMIRRVAGLGVIDATPASHAGMPRYEHVHLLTDVAVVGGGPSGMRAALQAAAAGDSVTLIDDQPELGGHLLDDSRLRVPGSACPSAPERQDEPAVPKEALLDKPAVAPAQALPDEPAVAPDGGRHALAAVLEQVARTTNIRVLQNAFCFGFYEGNLLGIEQSFRSRVSGFRFNGRDSGLDSSSSELQPATPNLQPESLPPATCNLQSVICNRLIHLRAGRVVLATGAYEVPISFENNDRVGVMLSSGVRRMIARFGINPGRRAVILGDNRRTEALRDELTAAGIEVAGVVAPDDVVTVTGGRHVTGVRTVSGRIACDLVVVCGPRVPDVGLIGQAGGKVAWNERIRAFVPGELPAHVSVVGSLAGEGLEANGSVIRPDRFDAKRAFICLCEDVTTKDLAQAIDEGFDHIQTLKRYTTVTMGPCQGRMCQLASIGLCAERTGKTLAETGTTTARPPHRSVSLGTLAGPEHHPVRRTPLHAVHEVLGCAWMNMGEWKRPHYYMKTDNDGVAGAERRVPRSDSVPDDTRPADPDTSDTDACVWREYDAVRHGVGLIDVSTLGKIEVRGADAAALLEKVYAGRAGDLRGGRTRYAILCDDTGIVLDDGTISRLGDDRFFLTTTTGNVEFVESWLKWWVCGTGWCAHVTNVTGGYAAINIAGPKARGVLSRVTDCDLSPQAFRYLACREAEVGGIPCLMLRTGFVGEVSWELHCPSCYGQSLWEALMDAGREAGIRAVGVEAQRLLRLEKRHVIVGVDTDATSNPRDADLAWVAKLSKDDFIGKTALERAEGRAPGEKLVGFVVEDDSLPADGAAIVVEGNPSGRVTSVRYSPAVGRAIGIAWIAADAAGEGARFQIACAGRVSSATVTSRLFYDPEGTRLRQ